jgi:hypothetical protein
MLDTDAASTTCIIFYNVEGNGKMIMNCEWVRISREAVLSGRSSGDTREDHVILNESG